jgi:hypothetical protein
MHGMIIKNINNALEVFKLIDHRLQNSYSKLRNMVGFIGKEGFHLPVDEYMDIVY